MARNVADFEGVTPHDVWAVITDPHAYPDWVVGAHRIRDVDAGWPQPGSAFHHEVGAWPLRVKDNTKVREIVEPTRLVLEARARPAGVAAVTILLEDTGDDGTRVVLLEEPVAGPAKLVPKPVMNALTKARNAESLRRLRKLVDERRAADARPA
jgi:uncharacterized protein YndB with AHSA1/START domain